MATEKAVRTISCTGSGGLHLAATQWLAGEGSGPLVLFLHGGGQSRRSWSRCARVLASQGIDSVAFDARGHGDSDWSPDGAYTLDAMVADLLHVVPTLGRPVVLVGASLGGLVSLVGAPLLAEAVRALVLVDIVPRFDRRGGERVRSFMRSGIQGYDSLEDVATAVASYLPHRESRQSLDSLAERMRLGDDGRWYWAWDPRVLDGSGRSSADLEDMAVSAIGRLVGTPILLVRGGRSDVVGEEGIQHLLGAAPWAQVVTVPTAAHTAAGDDNDAFSEAVARFVQREEIRCA